MFDGGYNYGWTMVDKMQRLPTNEISKSDIRIPRGITLVDPQFHQSSKIDLLEAEIFFELLWQNKGSRKSIKLAKNGSKLDCFSKLYNKTNT